MDRQTWLCHGCTTTLFRPKSKCTANDDLLDKCYGHEGTQLGPVNNTVVNLTRNNDPRSAQLCMWMSWRMEISRASRISWNEFGVDLKADLTFCLTPSWRYMFCLIPLISASSSSFNIHGHKNVCGCVMTFGSLQHIKFFLTPWELYRWVWQISKILVAISHPGITLSISQVEELPGDRSFPSSLMVNIPCKADHCALQSTHYDTWSSTRSLFHQSEPHHLSINSFLVVSLKCTTTGILPIALWCSSLSHHQFCTTK